MRELNVNKDITGNSDLAIDKETNQNMFYGALPIHFELAKKLRNHQTEAELFLWKHLPYIKTTGIRFKRQHPVLYFIADFYCHQAKLIIEVDGGYHELPEQFLYDESRDAELKELGLKVLRFKNEEIFNDIEAVLKSISQEINDRIASFQKCK